MRNSSSYGTERQGMASFDATHSRIELHADDYGITLNQAHALLDIMQTCREAGASTGLSIFANSPCFEEAAAAARGHIAFSPYADASLTRMRLHVNLVEGASCAPAAEVPLLVNARGTFEHDFIRLLRLSHSSEKGELKRQITHECSAQIARFLQAFPEAKSSLQLDSHQHAHAIPLISEALLDAARACACKVTFLRSTIEPISPHRAARTLRYASLLNLGKVALLNLLWKKSGQLAHPECATAMLCGVMLSGAMEHATPELAHALEEYASSRAHTQPPRIEMLFHPVSVPRANCLDPDNEPFAAACASPSRDAEARTIVRLAQNL